MDEIIDRRALADEREIAEERPVNASRGPDLHAFAQPDSTSMGNNCAPAPDDRIFEAVSANGGIRFDADIPPDISVGRITAQAPITAPASTWTLSPITAISWMCASELTKGCSCSKSPFSIAAVKAV